VIPQAIQHAIARPAEVERARRARVINAEAEFQAAARLGDAADLISRNPVTIQLRYLQTLIDVSNNQSSTIIFPLPIDVLQPLIGAAKQRLTTAEGPERERLDEALTAAHASLEAASQDQLALEEPSEPLDESADQPAALEEQPRRADHAAVSED
jgi:hypothetical protein